MTPPWFKKIDTPILYSASYFFFPIFDRFPIKSVTSGKTKISTLEAISKIGFWFKVSRRRSAGQECWSEIQPIPSIPGIFDTQTPVCREVETRIQHIDVSASGGLG